MPFRAIFVAIVIAGALIVGAFLLHQQRPEEHLSQPSQEFIRATGKCAECHRRETSAVVHEFQRSAHAVKGVTCLDCHKPMDGQEEMEHRGFVISKDLTAKNCQQCHSAEYRQFVRSRHGAPAWAAVTGKQDFTQEQIKLAEKYHPGAVDRPPNKLAQLEGPAAMSKGCMGCHQIGKPNPDGSIGSCTDCHSRHNASIQLARTPETCGQCHMGPDHAQLEIYNESKHGVLYNAQKEHLDLTADPKQLTTEDMFVPTCATCHMSGLEGENVTHNVSERLSYFLFSPVSEKRSEFHSAQNRMKAICLKCHTEPSIDSFYNEAENVLKATNHRVKEARSIIQGLRDDGLLTKQPFDEPIEFLYFDYWHYYGRTAKHGAFMGGADFVQWHGNYELLRKLTKLKKQAKEIRQQKAEKQKAEKEQDASKGSEGGEHAAAH